MTVTKQQQLEWLAKNYSVWPGFNKIPLRMSVVNTGGINNGLGQFHAITIEEWQQERDKMSSKPEVDNSWHDRGELPPAGCECEVLYGGNWVSVFVIGADINGNCVFSVPSFLEIDMSYDGIPDSSKFRPIRTEREKAIDAACEVIGGVIGGRLIIERLYDAGMLK